ncbi:hypothetical protein [Alistipes shahii]|uniref:Lipocalin-like domain-containing protein n=1 Tax=Alistipes shahii TaxID=328814 RepID=A0A5B3G1D0_9BACT|nr:hypothetical protein [Alistipes shahii]KAA2367231.1 hypothetical protein F2Y13_12135 [Alistipes shahii]
MKSIKLLLIGLAAAFALTGCGDSSKDTPEPEGDGNVVGSWHLVSWSSLQSADVYLSFSESGSFDIYQRLYKPEYVHLDGTYSYDKPTLSGRYSDNTPVGKRLVPGFVQRRRNTDDADQHFEHERRLGLRQGRNPVGDHLRRAGVHTPKQGRRYAAVPLNRRPAGMRRNPSSGCGVLFPGEGRAAHGTLPHPGMQLAGAIKKPAVAPEKYFL